MNKEFLREKSSPAEVICWSGATDSGTSADVQGGGGGGIAVGAMSYAFLSALSESIRRAAIRWLIERNHRW